MLSALWLFGTWEMDHSVSTALTVYSTGLLQGLHPSPLYVPCGWVSEEGVKAGAAA